MLNKVFYNQQIPLIRKFTLFTIIQSRRTVCNLLKQIRIHELIVIQVEFQIVFIIRSLIQTSTRRFTNFLSKVLRPEVKLPVIYY